MANIYDMTDVWNDGATTFTSIKMNATDTASAADSKLLDLQVGSSSKVSVDKAGKITATDLQVDNVNVNSNTISSTTGNLVLDPYSGAKISLDGLLWPNADGTANQMLQTDGAGNLSWGTPAAGYSDSDVDTHLNTGSATSGQTLQWNGTDYAWGTPASSYGDSDVNANLNTSAATTNQVLSWNGTDYAWVAQTGGDLVTDTTPQLGGALDVNGNAITSTSAGNIAITPDTTGSVVLDGQSWPQADGTANQVLQTNGSGQLSWVTYSGATGYGDNDVDLHLNRSSATSGQVLGWNGTDYAWVANSGGSSYTDSDVDTHLNQSTAQANEVLSWNGTDYDWVAQTAAYTDSDVDTHLNQSNPTSGYVLSWNGTDYAWVAQTAAYTDSSVDAHLNRSSASSGQILSYNGTDYAWIADAGITDVVSDTTPQLGGNLDLNTNDITGTGNIDLTGTITATSGGSVIPFYFADQAAFPNATTYHGAIAHSHADGAMYFAHGGSWNKLADTTAATTSVAGLMAAADKTKLDAINQSLATTDDVAFNDLVLAGDLTVNGTNNIIDTTNLAVSDSIIELSNGLTTAPINDAGIVIERGTADNAFIGWDESEDKFVLGTGSFTGTSSGNLTITKGDVALGTVTTVTDAGNTVDVRRADRIAQGSSVNVDGGATLYDVTATATLTLSDLVAGDIVTIFSRSGTTTIARGTITYAYIDGDIATNKTSVTVGAGTLATVTMVSDDTAIIAGSDLT